MREKGKPFSKHDSVITNLAVYGELGKHFAGSKDSR